MRKLWMAILLTPCFTFGAYPIYENDFVEEEVGAQQEQEQIATEKPAENVLQYGLKQEPVAKDEPLVLEDSAQEEMTVLPPKQEESKAKSPSQVRKKQAATAKRAPMRKTPTLQNGNSPRTQVQKSRQNSNRPKVTQRNIEKKSQENLMEADAQGDAPARIEKEPVQKRASAAKKQTSQAEKKEVVSKSSKSAPERERGSKASVQRKNLKRPVPKVSTHRPGKRPISE